MFFILFAIAVGFAFGADIFDVIESEKAYAKGYVESFDWLVGSKPTAIALYLRDGMLIAFASAPALILFLLHSTPVAYGALAGPIAAGARHIQGGLGAKKLK